MPDDQLLLKFGIDLGPINQAFTEIRRSLTQLSTFSDTILQKSTVAAGAQAAQLDKIKSNLQASILLSQKSAASKQEEAAGLRVQVAESQKLGQIQKTNLAAEQARKAEIQSQTALIQQQIQQERLRTAELQRQAAEYRKILAEQRAAHKETGGEGGGIFGKLGESVSRGLLGKGLAGTIAGGVIAGGGITMAMEAGGRALEAFLEKVKEVVEESSKLVVLQRVFEGLAKGAGVDATKMLNDLGEASGHLVGRVELLKLANAALGSTFHLSSKEVLETTAAITKLADNLGIDASEALMRFTRQLQTGHFSSKGLGLGIADVNTKIRDFSPTMSYAERQTAMFRLQLEQLRKEAERFPEDYSKVPITIETMMTRHRVAMQNLLLSFGAGIQESSGFFAYAKMITEMSKSMEKATDSAEGMGKKFGTFFGIAAIAGKSMIGAFTELGKLIGSIATLIGNILTPANVAFREDTDKTVEKFRQLHPVVYSLMLVFHTIGDTVGVIAIQIRQIIDDINEWIDVVKHPVKATVEAVGKSTLELMGKKRGKSKAELDKLDEETPYKPGEKVTHEPIDYDKPIAQLVREGRASEVLDYLKRSDQDFQNKIKTMQRREDTPGETKEILPQEEPKSGERFSTAMKMARLRMQVILAEAKNRIAIKRDEIEQFKELDDAAYREREESLEKHVENMKTIAERSRKAREEEIETEYLAHRAQIEDKRFETVKRSQGAPGAIADANAVAEKELDIAKSNRATQLTLAETAERRQKAAADNLERQDRREALLKDIREEFNLEKERIQHLQELNEKGLSGGKVGPQGYIQTRLNLIVEEANRAIEEADRVYLATANKETALSDRRKAIQEASLKAMHEIDMTAENYAQKAIQRVEREYAPQVKVMEDQIRSQKELGSGREGRNPVTQVEQLVAVLQREREELQTNLVLAEKGSDLWYQTYEKIEGIWASQVKWNRELMTMRDTVQIVFPLIQQMGKAIQDNFHSKFAQNLAEVFNSGINSLQKSSERVRIILGLGPKKDPAMVALEREATQLFSNARDSLSGVVSPMQEFIEWILHATDAIRDMTDAALNAAGKAASTSVAAGESMETVLSRADLKRNRGRDIKVEAINEQSIKAPVTLQLFVDKTTAAVAALSEFVSTLTQSKSAIAGAFGGGVSGVGLGKVLGAGITDIAKTMASDPNKLGMLGSVGSFLSGPMGQLAMGAAGAVVGAIVGAKNAQVTAHIHEFETTFRNVMHDFSMNTNNLNDTISRVTVLLQEVRSMQGQSKKGSAQYQQLADQYIQQIEQLQVQQHQLLLDLGQQLAVLQAPTGMQQYLTTLEGIFKQFQQFWGAASTQAEKQNAALFLTLSLQQNMLQNQQQYNQDNQQAVQDAINLNDMLRQRHDLIQQINDQIQGVLTQGVLTRQRTRAETAGSQIQQIQYNAEIQMQNLNEQIQAAEFRVSAEGQIFQLATSRVGLETQLLQLQNNQTTYDMLRITALQGLVNQMSGINWGALTQNATIASFPIQAIIAALPKDSPWLPLLLSLAQGTGTVGSPGPPPVSGSVTGAPLPGSGGIPPGSPRGLNSRRPSDTLDYYFAGAYQDRGASGYAAYRGQGI